MKALWLSALIKDEAAVQKIMTQMKTYGLQMLGHFWQNDNAKLSWTAVLAEMVNAKSTMWLILANREDLENTDLRYGLSMLALNIQARMGAGFPILILQRGGELLTPEQLPTPLQRAVILPADNAGTPAKIIAKSHAKAPELPVAYYIDMVGSPQVGQWFEVRPTRDTWSGVIFGIDEGDIRFQAVGPAGKLPDKTSLAYPMQGLKVQLGEKEYTAWAVRNDISQDQAYYIKVEGFPGTLIFGAFSEDAQADMYFLHLK